MGYFHALATVSDINNYKGLSTFRGFLDEEDDLFSALLLESNIKESDISNLIRGLSKHPHLSITEEGLILDLARQINGTLYNREEYEKELIHNDK